MWYVWAGLEKSGGVQSRVGGLSEDQDRRSLTLLTPPGPRQPAPDGLRGNTDLSQITTPPSLWGGFGRHVLVLEGGGPLHCRGAGGEAISCPFQGRMQQKYK